MLVTALAAVAAFALVGAAQDPTFEYPAVKNIGFDLPRQTFAPLTQSKAKVTVSFRNAAVREVLDWLKNSGVNFVISDDEVSRDARISVNIANQPLDDLMNALASAWNGHWDRQGDVWVFHKGIGLFSAPPSPFSVRALQAEPPGTNKSPEFRVYTDRGDGPIVLQQKDDSAPGAPANPFFGTKPVPQMPDTFGDAKQWEKFRQAWEEWAKAYEKNYQDFEKNFKGKNFGMDDQSVKALQKQAEEMAKSAQKFREQIKIQGQDGNPFDGQIVTPLDQEQTQKLQKRAQELLKESEAQRGRFLVIGGQQDLAGLLNSLTAGQRAKIKKDGFLRYSDLDSHQKSMLGQMGEDGTWTLTYKSDKGSLTIKSNR
ncbi:MAG TPA: hypothetical protein VMI31_02145 [Fimbriimonadaceae bacterium]|nr:hypothetical protein [Fimbriimonadaceae bacterium]